MSNEDKPSRQHISARLDSDLIAAIKERAEAEHRSTNNMIECLLFDAMAEKQETHNDKHNHKNST